MSRNCVITKINERPVAFYYEQQQLVTIEVLDILHENTDTVQLGGIYTGRIVNIVANINAAFVDIGGQTCYLSLEGNPHITFLNYKKNDKPHIGDQLLVQVIREPIKSKQAALTCDLNLTGTNLVLTLNRRGIGISKKISGERRREIKTLMHSYVDDAFGWVVRTNAFAAADEGIVQEAEQLTVQLREIQNKARCAVSGKCLYRNLQWCKELLNHIGSASGAEIVTDVKEVYDALLLENETRSNPCNVSWYDKEIPLRAVYECQKQFDEALSKYVWLKGGGSLVIEVTEALTVIDVNTGKSIRDNKSKEEHVTATNLIAASEIARQLRLRNLSGIILVDFIDMANPSHQKMVMNRLAEEFAKDSVKTTLVDMTQLGLVEITRHKIKKPLHEQYQKLN